MTEEILTRLLSGEAVSGQTLSEELGVTRAAVWKQIGQLRELGFDIEACGGQGYRLVSVPDSLMAPVIARGLNTKWAGKPIIYLRSVDSTNRYARAMAADGAGQGTLSTSTPCNIPPGFVERSAFPAARFDLSYPVEKRLAYSPASRS